MATDPGLCCLCLPSAWRSVWDLLFLGVCEGGISNRRERPLVTSTPGGGEGLLEKWGKLQSKTDLLQISPRANKNF